VRKPTIVLDFEVTGPLPDRDDLDRYSDAQILLRLHGRPIGYAHVPIEHGRLATNVLVRQILDVHGWMFAAPLAERALHARRPPTSIDVRSLLTPCEKLQFNLAPSLNVSGTIAEIPLVTVAVCTRDRADDLARCLDALLRLDYPRLDLLVIDNAPATDATERLVRARYPDVRYVREPRPGLDWARNRAILESRGEILAYTDDDVIVDRGWVSALVRVFTADPGVMAVTGLVIPHDLETDAQRLFEIYGGFGRGFLRRWYRGPAGRPLAPLHGGTGKFGTGANMAYRRRVFDEIGGFDPALDVGTCTNGGGDLEMYFRVLKHGHTLVYEPSAIVRHRHRVAFAQLRTQIANNGVGFYSFLVAAALRYRDERTALARLGLWWFRWWNLRRFVNSLSRRERRLPRELIVAEIAGSIRGLRRYQRARTRAAAIAAEFPAEPTFQPKAQSDGTLEDGKNCNLTWHVHRMCQAQKRVPEAVRHIDVAEELAPIADAGAYERVRIFVSWLGTPIGTVSIEHHGACVSPLWLADAISQNLTVELLDLRARLGEGVLWARMMSGLADVFAPAGVEQNQSDECLPPLSSDVSVSVVVATRDRPHDLQRCLESLVTQRTSRAFEIIVVDNNPASAITGSIVRQFPVRLIEETRAGLSYARNAGIVAATGDIIATTDDDAVCQPDWIERLVAPFRRGDVMVVTGNVLPVELETDAQRMFESYAGLSRGYNRFTADRDWFHGRRKSVPTWELGCTANAAFRACIFSDPAIGLMDEALGAGTPTGCSEDTLVFYRVLKAGYAIAYEPDAVVWHRHRDTMEALRKQIYSYSKGHVAYHLTTWLEDGDRRALVRLLYELPRIYLKRARHRLRGGTDYPLSFIALELLGNLAGPWALWQSRRRVGVLGRSGPIVRRPASTDSPDQIVAA
jgi:O-antigen biosynthesis protein